MSECGMSTQPTDDQIDEICQNINWFKIWCAMRALGWTWASAGGVPREGQIEESARELLRHVAGEGDGGYISTGGLEARNAGGFLSLRFVLAGWDMADD